MNDDKTISSATLERALGEIIVECKDAIYDCVDLKDEGSRLERYEKALSAINDFLIRLGPPKAVDAYGQRSEQHVSLPDLWMGKCERMGHVYGVHVLKEGGAFVGNIYRDQVLMAKVTTSCGKVKCVSMAMASMRALAFKSEWRIRKRIRKNGGRDVRSA